MHTNNFINDYAFFSRLFEYKKDSFLNKILTIFRSILCFMLDNETDNYLNFDEKIIIILKTHLIPIF